MTETEATYKTEERLPECETGSVERMLEAAIKWNRGIASDMVFDMAPHDVRLLRDRQDSQTKLLRNILAKIRGSVKASVVARGEHEQRCPQCNADIGVLTQLYNLELKYIPEHTTHG